MIFKDELNQLLGILFSLFLVPGQHPLTKSYKARRKIYIFQVLTKSFNRENVQSFLISLGLKME